MERLSSQNGVIYVVNKCFEDDKLHQALEMLEYRWWFKEDHVYLEKTLGPLIIELIYHPPMDQTYLEIFLNNNFNQINL